MMHQHQAYTQQQSMVQHQSAYVQQPHQNSYVHMHQNQMQPQQMAKLIKRPIAPAPLQTDQLNRVSSTINNSKKTKMSYAQMGYTAAQPASVQRRNARERNRVKQVNMGFANLRQHIPSDVITNLSTGGRGASKKLSKVDTLRLAVEYIRSLKGLIDDSDVESLSASTSSSLSNSSYYSASPVCNAIPPPCSESSASPTPSYSSDNSSINNFNMTAPAYDYPVYNNYQPSPDDDDLLDAISYWQQQ